MQTMSKKGFTLVEIMILVVILLLLAAMAIPAIQKVRQVTEEKAINKTLTPITADNPSGGARASD